MTTARGRRASPCWRARVRPGGRPRDTSRGTKNGQVRHAESGGPDGHRAGELAAVAELHGIACHSRPRRAGAVEHRHPELGQPLGHRASAPRMQVRTEHLAADQAASRGVDRPPPLARSGAGSAFIARRLNTTVTTTRISRRDLGSLHAQRRRDEGRPGRERVRCDGP